MTTCQTKTTKRKENKEKVKKEKITVIFYLVHRDDIDNNKSVWVNSSFIISSVPYRMFKHSLIVEPTIVSFSRGMCGNDGMWNSSDNEQGARAETILMLGLTPRSRILLFLNLPLLTWAFHLFSGAALRNIVQICEKSTKFGTRIAHGYTNTPRIGPFKNYGIKTPN